MSVLFKEKQIIKIIPDNVEFACNMQILNSDDKFIRISSENSDKALTGDVECFSVADEGILYFKSVLEKEGTNFKLIAPSKVSMLQRREYSRTPLSAEVIMKSVKAEIRVKTTDISAGGMQILSAGEIAMSADYNFTLELDKYKSISAVFTPIRQDKNNDGSYTISGKFTTMESRDRIALVQFCFKKQMENTNR